MTTFQDPPPQSRRSARQSERAEVPEAFDQFPPQQQFIAPQTPAAPTVGAPTAGRRARPAVEEQPEPLNYTTQGAQPVNYEQQLPAAGYTPPPAAEPAPYRVRDFSPEGSGRRAAAPPLIEPQQSVYSAGASDLDYRTQGAPVAPPAGAPPVLLSRRELRQRQAEADAAAGIVSSALQEPVNPALLTQPPSPRTAPPPTAAPMQAAPPPAATVTTPPPAATLMTPPPAATVTQPPSLRTAPPPAGPTTLSNAKSEFEALTRNGQPPAPHASQRVEQPDTPTFIEPELEHTGGWIAPVGHWSRQADLDDETQPWENTVTREVGGGNVATTTSALVLPEIPRPTVFPTALDSTGEVLLTGSIELPSSLSTGGGDSRRYDDPNVDLMFDTQDAEFNGTDSSPVRAISAVSTHTSARGVIHANKQHGNRMIVVVFVATAVLAVGVVGMLIASLALNLF